MAIDLGKLEKICTKGNVTVGYNSAKYEMVAQINDLGIEQQSINLTYWQKYDKGSDGLAISMAIDYKGVLWYIRPTVDNCKISILNQGSEVKDAWDWAKANNLIGSDVLPENTAKYRRLFDKLLKRIKSIELISKYMGGFKDYLSEQEFIRKKESNQQILKFNQEEKEAVIKYGGKEGPLDFLLAAIDSNNN